MYMVTSLIREADSTSLIREADSSMCSWELNSYISIHIRSTPGEGNGHSLQYSCLQNPVDRRAWQVTTIHGVAGVRHD